MKYCFGTVTVLPHKNWWLYTFVCEASKEIFNFLVKCFLISLGDVWSSLVFLNNEMFLFKYLAFKCITANLLISEYLLYSKLFRIPILVAWYNCYLSSASIWASVISCIPRVSNPKIWMFKGTGYCFICPLIKMYPTLAQHSPALGPQENNFRNGNIWRVYIDSNFLQTYQLYFIFPHAFLKIRPIRCCKNSTKLFFFFFEKD